MSSNCSNASAGNHELNLDQVLQQLLTGRRTCQLTQQVEITKKDAYIVANVAATLFQAEELCIEINEDVVVVGDIHGQFDDLLRIIRASGFPPNVRYLFLGDYVDRGVFSLEVIMLLFLLKIKFPDNIFLLRGNHETKSISSLYGFRDEIKTRFGNDDIWRAYCKAFSNMPVCAVVAKKFFCCHGGLAQTLLQAKIGNGVQALIDYINKRNRPYVVVRGTELFDLLWSDPEDPVRAKFPMFKAGNRGCTVYFNEKAVKDFLKKYDLKKIIRAHQVAKDGFKKYCGNNCLTIFSAPGYSGLQTNLGAICTIAIGKRDANGIPLNIDMKIDTLKPSMTHFNCKDLWVKAADIQNARQRASVRQVRLEAEHEARADKIPGAM